MPDDAAFLRAILANPDDDLPRLIYADYLDERGDPRGEFVRVQVELARRPGAWDGRDALVGRQNTLLHAHRDRWLSPVRDALQGEVVGWGFHRGFVQVLTLSSSQLLARADELFNVTPLQDVSLRLETLGDLAHVISRAWFGRLRGLAVRDIPAGDVIAMLLALSPFAHGLRRLDLEHTTLGPDGAGTLVESPKLAGLQRLDLSRNPLGDPGLLRLARAPLVGRLEYLSVARTGGTAASARALRQVLGGRVQLDDD